MDAATAGLVVGAGFAAAGGFAGVLAAVAGGGVAAVLVRSARQYQQAAAAALSATASEGYSRAMHWHSQFAEAAAENAKFREEDGDDDVEPNL